MQCDEDEGDQVPDVEEVFERMDKAACEARELLGEMRSVPPRMEREAAGHG
jgi:hypothetical protein